MKNVEVNRTCPNQLAVLPVPLVREAIASIRASLEKNESPEAALLALSHMVEHPIIETYCRYTGLVTLVCGEDESWWVCPLCRHVVIEAGCAH